MVLIVGHSGFLGSHLYQRFPKAFCINSSGMTRFGSVLNFRAEELIKSGDVKTVLYSAVSYNENDPTELRNVNFIWPKQLLQTCAEHHAKFVYFGSFFEKHAGAFRRSYIQSKLDMRRFMEQLDYKNSHYVRLEHIYGTNDGPTKFIPSLVRNIVQGREICLNDPLTVRDFTPVEYVIDTIDALISEKFDENFFELGAGYPQVTLSFVKKVVATIHENSPCRISETIDAIQLKDIPSDVVRFSYAKNAPLRKEMTPFRFAALEYETINSIRRSIC